MSEGQIPEWFKLSEELTPLIHQRISFALSNSTLPVEVKTQPLQAHWHLLNTLQIANKANRDGMHANALSITRQCIECISIIELGVCGHPDAPEMLARWSKDDLTPGATRAWLERNVWPSYGSGLWSERWADYMSALARSLQPYAHYSAPLSQWYGRMHGMKPSEDGRLLAIMEIGPKTYDPQKATRITLYHGLIHFTLARIWHSTLGTGDLKFGADVDQLRIAIGASRYLDGDGTKWGEQFWAMMWFRDGNPK
jgi:hypothetical protein